jgi:tellurite resistance protein
MSCAAPGSVPAPRTPASLEHLGLIGFVPVMGLCGLSLAWVQAAGRMGEVATRVAQATAVVAAVLMLVLLGITLWRFARWPLTRVQDAAHPVRHVFVAAPTVSLILLATCGVALTGPSPGWDALWMAGAVAQAAVTAWVVLRWWRMRAARWLGVTPALLIPVVGHVLLPLAGLSLGHPVWSAMQWAVGAVLWPVVLLLLALRLQRVGPWPARMRASVFILIAPPAAMGLGLSLWKVSPVWPLVLWGVALVFVVLALRQLPQCFDQPFGWPMWSLSFPLTAFAALTLRLAHAGVLPQLLALLALALASVVVAALLRWTWWGLRSGDLLQPEPGPVPKQ